MPVEQIQGTVSVNNFPKVQEVTGKFTVGNFPTSFNIGNFPAVQAVSIASLPVGTGASTSALQITGNTFLTSINNKLPTLITGRIPVDGSGVIQPISGTIAVSNFPATQAVTQSGTWTIGLTTESIEIGTVDQGTPGSLANAWPVKISDGTNLLGILTHPVRIDPTGTTTQPVSAASLPLPSGASTEATLALIKAKTDNLDVALSTRTKPADTQAVSAASLPLPLGASTAALQTTGNTSLSSIDGKIIAVNTGAVVIASSALPSGAAISAKQPALGVAGTASADVITIQGIAAMTALKVDGSAATQPVSGTVTANAGTNLNTSALALDATLIGGTQKSKLVDTGGTNVASVSAAGALKVDGSAVTQPVSGTVTANAGTNLNTSALALDVSVTGLQVSQGSTTSGEKGPLTQGAVTTGAPAYTTAQTNPLSLTTSGALRVDLGATSANATAIKVDGSAVTQPVSGTVTANIGTTNGLALDASITGLQITQGSTTSGQKELLIAGAVTTSSPAYTTAQSSPLSLTTAGALRIDSSATTQPISAASLPLPSGASTSALQTTGNTSLSSIDGKITAVNTGAVVVSSSALPTGASTEATLALIKAKTDNLDVLLSSRTKPADTQTVSGSVSVSNFPATQPVSGSVTSNQGTANTNVNSWPVILTDGTNPITVLQGALYVKGPTSVVGSWENDILESMVMELRAIRLAIVSMATESGRSRSIDFEPTRVNFSLSSFDQ